MTSNNETVSRQMPRADNIAKTMTSNGKQFIVAREMLTAVARDQRWSDVVAGVSARFSKFAFVLFCYITNHVVALSSRVNPVCQQYSASWMHWETLRFSGNKIHCSPRDQSLSVNYNKPLSSRVNPVCQTITHHVNVLLSVLWLDNILVLKILQ